MSMQSNPSVHTTAKPVVAGIIDLVAGSFGLMGAIIVAFGVLMFFPAGRGVFGGMPANAIVVWLLIAVPVVVSGVISILGGIYNLKREKWDWALAGSITAALLTIIGIASIVLTAISKDEFEQ